MLGEAQETLEQVAHSIIQVESRNDVTSSKKRQIDSTRDWFRALGSSASTGTTHYNDKVGLGVFFIASRIQRHTPSRRELLGRYGGHLARPNRRGLGLGGSDTAVR